MKSVEMFRDHLYRPPGEARLSVQFLGGRTYRNVLETAASAIVAAGAGRILPECTPVDPAKDIDCWNAWTRRR